MHFLQENQGTLVLAALRAAGVTLPVLMSMPSSGFRCGCPCSGEPSLRKLINMSRGITPFCDSSE